MEHLNMKYIKPDPDVAGIGVVSSTIAVGASIMVLVAIKIWREHRKNFHLIDLIRPRAALTPASGRWVTVKDAKDCLALHQEVQERVSILDLTIFSLADIQLSIGIATAVAAIAKHDILAYHYWVSLELCWLIFMTSTAGFTVTTDPFMVSNFERNIVRTGFIWCLFILTLYLFFRIDDTLEYNEEAYSQPGHWSIPEYRVELALLIYTIVCLLLQTMCLSRVYILLVDYYVQAPLTHMGRNLIQFWGLLIATKDELRSFGTRNFYSTVLISLRIFGLLYILIIGCITWCFLLVMHLVWVVPPITHSLSIFFFIWETRAIFSIRREGERFMTEEDQNGEGQFGFGQIVALTLLISPIIANAEKWLEAFRIWLSPAPPSQPEEVRRGVPKSQETRETIVAL